MWRCGLCGTEQIEGWLLYGWTNATAVAVARVRDELRIAARRQRGVPDRIDVYFDLPDKDFEEFGGLA